MAKQSGQNQAAAAEEAEEAKAAATEAAATEAAATEAAATEAAAAENSKGSHMCIIVNQCNNQHVDPATGVVFAPGQQTIYRHPIKEGSWLDSQIKAKLMVVVE